MAEAPTANEDLASKPAAQIAFPETYPTGYGLAPAVAGVYKKKAQQYRDLYYRLHAEVDGPLDRVRRAVTEGNSGSAVIVRTSDHGDLLGAHGGLHQKWSTSTTKQLEFRSRLPASARQQPPARRSPTVRHHTSTSCQPCSLRRVSMKPPFLISFVPTSLKFIHFLARI